MRRSWCTMHEPAMHQRGDARRMPGGFKTEVDKDGWRH
jgi:hypothetical protein